MFTCHILFDILVNSTCSLLSQVVVERCCLIPMKRKRSVLVARKSERKLTSSMLKSYRQRSIFFLDCQISHWHISDTRYAVFIAWYTLV